ncbi:MAG: LuxR C-terminal-related transcriptional regulator [Novosphingobium sp.]
MMFAKKSANAQACDAGTIAEASTLFRFYGTDQEPDLFSSLRACKSAANLCDWLLNYARQLGFYGARYIHVGSCWCDQSDAVSCQPLRFVTTSPRDIVDAEDWLARDPCAAHARTAFAPFAYSTRVPPRIDPLQRFWLENERMRGVAAGVVLPVQDSAHGPAYISLFGTDEPGSRALVERCAAELAFSAAHFHAKAKQLVPVADWVPRLSNRELQCLRLAAQGHTTTQSGEALGISERTVEYHLRNASDKLGAPTKLRAVVLAFAQGLASF